MWSFILALVIYWFILFVACFVVVEIGQDQLYDEVTPRGGLKVTGGSLLLALALAVFRKYDRSASFETMFTTNIIWTVLNGIIWFGVFTLILQFHPWHALGIGLATMVLVTGLATMGVDSLMSRPVPTTKTSRPLFSGQPVRQPATPRATTAPSASGTPGK